MEGDSAGVERWGKEAEAAKAQRLRITAPTPLNFPRIRVSV